MITASRVVNATLWSVKQHCTTQIVLVFPLCRSLIVCWATWPEITFSFLDLASEISTWDGVIVTPSEKAMGSHQKRRKENQRRRIQKNHLKERERKRKHGDSGVTFLSLHPVSCPRGRLQPKLTAPGFNKGAFLRDRGDRKCHSTGF